MTLLDTPSAGPILLPTIWANGRLYDDSNEPTVSVRDHGLVVGDGVFEALKVTSDGVFAIQRHLNRMDRSAAAMGLPAPDHQLIREGIAAVLEGRTFTDGKIRITYTGGLGPLGSQAAYGPVTLVVAAEATAPVPSTTTIVTVPWRRNEFGALTGVKSTSYAENVRALAYATDRGASESIFLNTTGNVCEGTGSNIFFVFGDEVVTPPLSAGALAGITREVLLEWTDITERDVVPSEALAADEVFITSSLRDVQGVTQWDETAFAADAPATARIARLFTDRSEANLEP